MQPSRLSTINKRSRHVRSPSSPVDIDEDPLTPTDMSYQRALTPTRPKTNIFGDPNRSSDNCTRILYVIIGLICIAIVGVIVLVIQMMSGDDRSANIQIHNEQVHQPEQQQQQQQHLPQLHHNHHHEPQQHQHQQHQQHHDQHHQDHNRHHIDFNDAEMVAKRDAIKNAFLFAWNGYERFAFGHDELRPLTNDVCFY
jgi:uncharacterized protein HemX